MASNTSTNSENAVGASSLSFVRNSNQCLFCGHEYEGGNLCERDVWTHFENFAIVEHQECLKNAIQYCKDARVQNNPTESETILIKYIHFATKEMEYKMKYFDIVISLLDELRGCTADSPSKALFHMVMLCEIVEVTSSSFLFKQALFQKGLLEVVVSKMKIKGFSPAFYGACMTTNGFFVLEENQDVQPYSFKMIACMVDNKVVDAITSIMASFPTALRLLICCVSILDMITDYTLPENIREFSPLVVAATIKALEDNRSVDSKYVPKLLHLCGPLIVFCMDLNAESCVLAMRVFSLFAEGIRTYYDYEDTKEICIKTIRFLVPPEQAKMVIESMELEYLECDCKYSPAA